MLDNKGVEKVRISKLLSEQGLCSRREADQYIEQGLVTVDGEVITELGSRAYPHQKIELKKEAKLAQNARVTVILNKPVGFISHFDEDKEYQPAASLITPDNFYRTHLDGPRSPRFNTRGLAPAGRLDIDSSGLLVLTQDGRIAKLLIGENSPIEKEYLVRVEGTLSDTGLATLRHGLSLDDIELKPAKVSWQNEDQLRFVLREGRKRQIRRMCEMVGLSVIGLKRIRIGQIPLGNLPVGQWRYLKENEKF
ncbi:MAG: pseudouridine synthase [Betaproteobacteria bacterium]|jgi:23S rRNA pseudouridine2604 synthase